MSNSIEFQMSDAQQATLIRLEKSSATVLKCLVNGQSYELDNCSASADGSSMKATVSYFWQNHDVLLTINKADNTGIMVINGFAGRTLSGTFDNQGEGAAVDAFIAACEFPPIVT